MQRYIVLIGDIEKSKSLEKKNRAQTQIKLANVLKKINGENGHWISPYNITLGDEFQAVYQKGDDLFNHIWAIMAEMYPVMVRFSIGIETISTSIETPSSIGMDGPAFHKAREGLNDMRHSKSLVFLSSDYNRADRLINSCFKVLTGNFRSWNKNRFKTLQLLSEGLNVKLIAKKLDISEVAVYKNIKAGNLDSILEAGESIADMINDIVKN